MKFKTRCFGELEVDEAKIIHFEEGLPGFEDLHRFVFIDSEDGIFNYLQSLEEQMICFVVIDPYMIEPSYAPVIHESYFTKLGGGENDDFVLLSIVCLKDKMEDSTLNLAGPLLIQHHTKKAIQVVCEDKKYTTKHKLLQDKRETQEIPTTKPTDEEKKTC